MTVDGSTVASDGCLGLSIRTECAEDVSSGDFSVTLVFGVGPCQTVSDLLNPNLVSRAINSSSGVCIPVGTTSAFELCYNVTLLYQSIVILTQTNLDFNGCSVASLEALLRSEVVYTLSGVADNRIVPHSTTASFACSSTVYTFSGVPSALCLDGNWVVSGSNSCSGNKFFRSA